MSRRKFIRNTLIGAAGIGVGTGLYAWQVEPFWLEFVKKKMPIKNLPDELKGKTLMQISDIHIGNRFDYQYIIDSFKKAKQFEPDLVVYTGDFVSYEDERQFSQLAEVLPHAVKGKLGTAGILGNHDYGKNWSEQEVADQITSQLEQEGIQVLSNEKAEVKGLTIIGLDDYWGLNFNPKQILNQVDFSEPSLVLCHNPDVCDLDFWNDYQSWILSGHTHGGQVRPPFLDPPILPVKNPSYSSGEIDLKDGRTLYINRAIGHLWQVRLNVRPEITLFELEQIT
ncbi:metallophosphoesterase [uncultured Algoriphagus sp.]|uniref:metallophosphoesterase n=1 Tax=uncultured Algoriphagus sp. TaxID=417365 RepID=UPI0030EC2E45|tara:strand:- start:23727 stop:24572 length:846 start_codon:yes stop_codon:yes gene_type:complete